MKYIIPLVLALLVFTSPALAQVPTDIMPGVCEDIHDSTADTVTLGENGIFSLRDAQLALRPDGGIIIVPYNDGIPYTHPDDFIYGNSYTVMDLTIRGILGPNGEKPKLSGTKGSFVSYGTRQVWGSEPAPANDKRLLIENLEVYGYPRGVSVRVLGGVVLKNNYFHHASNDGIGNLNMIGDQKQTWEICNNEFSHSGQGNSKHNLYLHRGLTETSWVSVIFVNNYCHSARRSHCYKSIANENIVIGNVFATNPSNDLELTYYGTTLTDISGCSNNIIANNIYLINTIRDGALGIAIRDRRSIHGCDRPSYDENLSNPVFHDHISSEEFQSEIFWDKVAEAGLGMSAPDYESSGNPMLFHSYVSGNTFIGFGPWAWKTIAITNVGLFPTKVLRKFAGCSYALPVPDNYIERSRVWVANNSYENIGRRYRERTETFCEPPSFPVSPGPIIAIGGEDGTPIVLPDWFNQRQLQIDFNIQDPIDLDIEGFRIAGAAHAGGNDIIPKLAVRNYGSYDYETRTATVIGIQDSIEIYRESVEVWAKVRSWIKSFKFPPYQPTVPGNILWTVTIADDDPDDDTATVKTLVD